MPKQTLDRETILETALQITRANGFDAVNARSVAAATGHSVQPIYSYFQNMEDLKVAVYQKAMTFYKNFISFRADGSRLMESMGFANIAFAREETHLFRLLFMTKLEGYDSFQTLFNRMGDSKAAQGLSEEWGIPMENAQELYIMLIVFTHGIASMLAADAVQIADEEIHELMKRAYKAFCSFEQQRNNENR